MKNIKHEGEPYDKTEIEKIMEQIGKRIADLPLTNEQKSDLEAIIQMQLLRMADSAYRQGKREK